LTIDATMFLKEMNGSLEDYFKELRVSSWDSEVWKKFRKKMKSICKNTLPPSP